MKPQNRNPFPLAGRPSSSHNIEQNLENLQTSKLPAYQINIQTDQNGTVRSWPDLLDCRARRRKICTIQYATYPYITYDRMESLLQCALQRLARSPQGGAGTRNLSEIIPAPFVRSHTGFWHFFFLPPTAVPLVGRNIEPSPNPAQSPCQHFQGSATVMDHGTWLLILISLRQEEENLEAKMREKTPSLSKPWARGPDIPL